MNEDESRDVTDPPFHFPSRPTSTPPRHLRPPSVRVMVAVGMSCIGSRHTRLEGAFVLARTARQLQRRAPSVTPGRRLTCAAKAMVFGAFKKASASPAKPPAGTKADADLFRGAGVALAVPTLPTFVATRPVLDAFGLSNSDPTSFEALADIQHFSNLFGTDCFSLIALCSLYVLADAADNARLDSATYQRLAAALVLYAGANTLAVIGASVAAGDPTPSLTATAAVAFATAPAAAASASAINKYGGGLEGVVDRIKSDVELVKDLGDTSEQGGYLEFYYKLSFWASMIVGGSFAFSPLSPLAIINEFNPSSQFVQRAFGLGTVFMLAPAQFVLLDAARRGRLGGGTFKKLNLSIAAAIAGIDWMTVYTFQAATALSPDADALAGASGGIYNYVGALAVSFSILAVYLYQGLLAKK